MPLPKSATAIAVTTVTNVNANTSQWRSICCHCSADAELVPLLTTHATSANLSSMHRPRSLHVFYYLLLTVAAIAQTPAIPDAPPQTTIAENAPLNRTLPTLFIVGDSTARNQADLGWGDHLSHYFDTTRINVANRARAGRSSRTFINEGAWDKVLAEMKPGDFVLIQMGHNDGGDLAGTKPRGSIRGIGDEQQQITLPDGHQELVHTYGWYIRHYIDDTRGEQANPILLSLTIRNIWKSDRTGTPRIERDMGYDAELAQLAKEQGIPYIDMATVEADRLETLGPEKTAILFPVDHTHTSAEGAERNAESVVIALHNAHSPLVAYLKSNNHSK
jgi:rhamnogalacturonan acetylesterase